MTTTPEKLKHDAIVEALLEVQFEHTSLAEVIVGRLAAASPWANYSAQRLPLAELPATIRESDPGMRYQPTMQLNRPEPGEIVRIGANVISLHSVKPYPGWPSFSERLRQMVEAAFEVAGGPNIRRLGLRYINALTPLHQFKSLWDLEFDFTVKGVRPADELHAQYNFRPADDINVKVTLASPSYVVGNFPGDASAFVDVDVSTPEGLGPTTPDNVLDWIERAHEEEKRAFFSLWPEHALNALRES